MFWIESFTFVHFNASLESKNINLFKKKNKLTDPKLLNGSINKYIYIIIKYILISKCIKLAYYIIYTIIIIFMLLD